MSFQINFVAVLTAALIPFLVGSLWYSPILFAKPWARAHRFKESDLAGMRESAGKTYLVALICYLVMAMVFDTLVAVLGVNSAVEGAGLGGLIWLGFVATIGLTGNLFSDKSPMTYVIDVAYQWVYLVAMGAVLGGWR